MSALFRLQPGDRFTMWDLADPGGFFNTQPDQVGWTEAGISAPTVIERDITGLKDGQAYQAAVSYRAANGTGPRLILGPETVSVSTAQQIAVSTIATVNIQADYTGAVTTALPYVIAPQVTLGTSDITRDDGTTYSLSATGGVTASIDNTPGSSTKGNITITALSGITEQLSLQVSVAGNAQAAVVIQVNRIDAAPPVTGTKTASTSTYIVPFTASYAALIASLTGIVVAGGESLYGSATAAADIPGASFRSSQTFTAKWQYTATGGSSWTDFGAGQVSSATLVSGGVRIPAQLTLNQAVSPGAGTYDVRIVVLETDSSGGGFHAMTSASGSATIQAKV